MGKSESCTFDVVVADTFDPVITVCSAQSEMNADTSDPLDGVNEAKQSTSSTGAKVDWTVPTAEDRDANGASVGDSNLSVVYTAEDADVPDAAAGNVVTFGENGTTFPIGTVEVTATVTDTGYPTNKTDTCTFDVVVADTVVPVITACAGQNGTDVVVSIDNANVNAIQATNASGAVATWSAATSTDFY